MKINSVLIIGLGKFGTNLAMQFVKRKVSVMVLSKSEESVNIIAPYVDDAQIGDALNPAVLRSLGVPDFDVCFVTVGEDFKAALETTSYLKELGARQVVSMAIDETMEKFLLRNGADEVIFPERDIAEKTALRFSSDNIMDYIQITNEYSIFQIPVPEDWTGDTIASLDIRRKYGINILAIETPDGHVNVMPHADHVLGAEERLLILGKSEDVIRLKDRV